VLDAVIAYKERQRSAASYSEGYEAVMQLCDVVLRDAIFVCLLIFAEISKNITIFFQRTHTLFYLSGWLLFEYPISIVYRVAEKRG
jgi:hypothetical protein